MSKAPDNHGSARTAYNFLTGSPIELFRSAARYALSAPPRQLGRYTTPWALQEMYPIEARDVLKAVAGVDGPQTRIALRDPAVVLSAGATGGFSLLLRYLMTVFTNYNNLSGIFRTPTILTTSPTYGAFVDLASTSGFSVKNIDLVDKDLKVTLTPEALEKALDELHKRDDLFVSAFIDTSPHNPTGRVRTRQQTEELACVLANYEERRSRQLARSLDYAGEEFSDGYALIEPLVPLPIIDDLAYFGLEYRGTETHSFITLPGIAQHTHVLLSASKLGLPALRTGMVLTNQEMANRLTTLSYRSYDAPIVPVARAAQAVWSMQEPFLTQRRKHLERQRLLYRRNAQLVEALVNGIDQTAIAPEDRAWVRKRAGSFLARTKPEHRESLRRDGIPGLTVMTKGQKAGFFHILSFDQDIWQPIVSKLVPEKYFYPDTRYLETDEDLMNRLLNQWGITLLPSSWMNMNSNSSVYRMSFAKPAKDILAFALQLSSMTEGCIEKARNTEPPPIRLSAGITLRDPQPFDDFTCSETTLVEPKIRTRRIRIATPN